LSRLRYLTAGESHGPALVGIIEGLPSGLPLETSDIDRDLARRQRGYGRGGRMKIEHDSAEILSGVRFGFTIGSPLALLIRNRDFANWQARMQAAPGGPDPQPVTIPRPGHADLAGGLKYDHLDDLRNILERASARETAIRVALGAVARALLRDLGIQVGSFVRSIGEAEAGPLNEEAQRLWRDDAEALGLLADRTETRALDVNSSRGFVEAIERARQRRDTLGGVIEVVATGVPVGLGSHVQWDRKLDGRIAQAMMSIPAIKAVELGEGWRAAHLYGSQVHDPIRLSEQGLSRASNRAGGLEGGVSNGEPLVIRAAMKPLSTVPAALPSVDLSTLQAAPAHVERTDTCAVPSAGVIAEAVLALCLADALLEMLGGDTMASLRLPMARLRLSTRARAGHLFVIGPMGSGKSTVGAAVARRLGRPFTDLDQLVESRAGASITEIFATQGEPAFRKLESEALAQVVLKEAGVIAMGGGTVLNEGAWHLMRRHGAIFALTAPPEELARRLLRSERAVQQRPLLAGADPIERLRQLVRDRQRFYARADLSLNTLGLSVEDAAETVIGLTRSLEGRIAGRARQKNFEPPPDGSGLAGEDGEE
jgi:chorismate synthase